MLIHVWLRQNSMDMHAIRYFLVACEERSFTRAAKRCRVAQPSVSTAIQRLEKELGGPLFVRAETGVQLTPLGRAVRPYLERIDGLADFVRKTFSGGPVAGGVRKRRGPRVPGRHRTVAGRGESDPMSPHGPAADRQRTRPQR